MKPLFFGIAALLVGFPVNADTVWLLLREKSRYGDEPLVLEKIPTNSMEQCEEQGAIYMSSERLGSKRNADRTGFECFEGK